MEHRKEITIANKKKVINRVNTLPPCNLFEKPKFPEQ
jgi:hypothetical protein